MNIDEILQKMKAITDAAEERSLTDDEVTQYEELETQLRAAQKTHELRSRQAAYEAPNGAIQAAVHVGAAKSDDTLERSFETFLRTGVPNADIAELRARFRVRGRHDALAHELQGDEREGDRAGRRRSGGGRGCRRGGGRVGGGDGNPRRGRYGHDVAEGAGQTGG